MKHDSDILKRIKSYFMRRKSAEEAYKFEREMERDPFLYEAMEGFEDMLTSDIQQALDELDDRLDEKQKKKFIVFTWQAAAIGLVLIVGVSVFAILGSGNDEAETYSIEEINYSPRNVKPSFNDMDEVKDTYASEEAEESSEGDEAPTKSKALDFAVNEPTPVKEVRIQEDSKESMPTADLTPKKTQQEQAISEPIQDKAEAIVDEIAMQENVSESTAAPALKAASASEEIVSVRSNAKNKPTSSPEGGMASYQSYLKRNLQKSTGMPDGSVVVTFEFDKDGTPRKVQIAKSLCTACDAEAIRLIESGPKWNVEDRKERVSVTVSF
jgi:outer membrane biosynthesis protein TonB